MASFFELPLLNFPTLFGTQRCLFLVLWLKHRVFDHFTQPRWVLRLSPPPHPCSGKISVQRKKYGLSPYILQIVVSFAGEEESPQSFRFLPGHCRCRWPTTTQLRWDCGLRSSMGKKKEGKKGRKEEEGSKTRGSFPFSLS